MASSSKPRVSCAAPGCDRDYADHRWGSTRAHSEGWFMSKCGDSFCPNHLPEWVPEWRRRQAAKKGNSMALEIETFEKKPVQIQAVQYINTQTRANQIIDWIRKNGHEAHTRYETVLLDATTETGTTVPFEGSKLLGLEIVTLEGTMLATENDWIIRGVKGEFYPCKPDVFEDSYVKVGN